MAADTLKSVSITALDTVPIYPLTTGESASGYNRVASDYVTPTVTGVTTVGSTYKLIRLPSNAKLKSLVLNADAVLDSNAAKTLAFNVGATYSDSPNLDGTPPANQGVVINASAFAAALAFGATFQNVNALGSLGIAKYQQPLWQALGLSSDPGGYIDIVATVSTVAATGASANFGAVCQYVD